jgi:transposase
MPWTETTRPHYQRDGLRFASDMTDAEWALIARRLPARRRLGRPRTTNLRRVVEAILYVLATGCQWRALPGDFPPRSTVQGYFYTWRDTGLWQRVVTALVRRARRDLGRKPTPTAAIIDSQSAPTTEAGGPCGFDAGKRVHGRKRHIVTDTNGLLLAVHVHPANVQDVHGAVPLLKRLRAKFPKLRHVFADRVYRGDRSVDAAGLPRTSKVPSQALSPGSSSLISGSSPGGSPTLEKSAYILSQTLRMTAWVQRADPVILRCSAQPSVEGRPAHLPFHWPYDLRNATSLKNTWFSGCTWISMSLFMACASTWWWIAT